MEPYIKEKFQKAFPGLYHPQVLEELSEKASTYRVRKGEYLIQYGQYVQSIPLVLEGLIKVSRIDSDDHEIFLYYLQPGDACSASFSCCLRRKRSELKAFSEEDTLLLMIPVITAEALFHNSTVWRNFVFQTFEDKIISLIDTIDRLAFTKLDEQLQDYLWQSVSPRDSNILNVTHQKIAEDLNASREAISRLLKKLEKDGKVNLKRNEIELLV